ncbi:MAG: MFS transporter [Saprospiraceae bacterium]|nr:MFS transporter [Saprospiraceae bacterium]
MSGSRIFFGWWVLAALFIIYSITNGVILNTLPLFYPELIKEYGWTQDQVTRPAQLLFLFVAIFSPFAGHWMDKLHIKRMMYLGTALILLGFILFSRISSISMLMVTYFVFAMGITLAGIIPSMKIVTNWFVQSRGMAVGILLVGSSIGGAIFNQIAGSLIVSQGWRMALISLGVMSAIAILLPMLIAVKIHPSSMQMLPDGIAHQEKTSANISDTKGFKYAELLKSKVFYLLVFVTGAMWFCIVGVIQHQALFFKDLETTTASKNVLSLFFLCSVLGKIIFGKLSDHYPKRNIMFLAVVNLALGALVLTVIKSNPDILLWVYAVVFGIGFSGTFTMIQLLIAEYYHGRSYGKILGVFTMVDTMAGVLGIMTLGILRTKTGSYDQAFVILLTISILAAVCVLFLPRNQKV